MNDVPVRRPGPPRYAQLAVAFRRLIASNAWPLGGRVKTIDVLADEYGVARITVRQAMDILDGEGLIERSRGRGTHVVAQPEAVRWHRLTGTWEDFMWRSPGGQTRVLEDRLHQGAVEVTANEAVLRGRYRFLHVVTSRGGMKPVSTRRIWLQEDIYRRIKSRLREGMFMALLGENAVSLKAYVEFGEADAESAKLLEIAPGVPVLQGRHVALNASGELVYLDVHVLPAAYIKMEVSLSRPPV